jgi:hypothetical protein
MWHNVIMEPGKLERPSIRKDDLRHQDHMTMNVWVLNNPLVRFHHNEHKAIAWVKKHTNLEWDRPQVVLQKTFEVPKLALIKLISSHIL